MIKRIKKFSSPKIKIWFGPMFFSGFFCGFDSCGSAAFPSASWRIRGGTSSPPQAAKAVRTNSRILHHYKTRRLFQGQFVGGSQSRPLVLWRRILSARRADAHLAVLQNEVRTEQSSVGNLFL